MTAQIPCQNTSRNCGTMGYSNVVWRSMLLSKIDIKQFVPPSMPSCLWCPFSGKLVNSQIPAWRATRGRDQVHSFPSEMIRKKCQYLSKICISQTSKVDDFLSTTILYPFQLLSHPLVLHLLLNRNMALPSQSHWLWNLEMIPLPQRIESIAKSKPRLMTTRPRCRLT